MHGKSTVGQRILTICLWWLWMNPPAATSRAVVTAFSPAKCNKPCFHENNQGMRAGQASRGDGGVGGVGGSRSTTRSNIMRLNRLFQSFPSDETPAEASSLSESATPLLPPASQPVDYGALGKWLVGFTGQISLIYATLWSIDQLLAQWPLATKIPFFGKVIFFYFFNLKTSVFSLLPNKKVNSQKQLGQEDWEYNKRNRPWWTPPGIVFAIMWPLFVFGMRAVTASMVVSASPGQKLASPAIMTLMAHLCFANLWNTVNNIERRLGPSVLVLYALVLTKAATAFMFFRVHPLAGKLLALTLTWLTAAAALETNTWMINPDPSTGKKEPLYPVKSPKWTTRFRWES